LNAPGAHFVIYNIGTSIGYVKGTRATKINIAFSLLTFFLKIPQQTAESPKCKETISIRALDPAASSGDCARDAFSRKRKVHAHGKGNISRGDLRNLEAKWPAKPLPTAGALMV
jgi:hypothetical protein